MHVAFLALSAQSMITQNFNPAPYIKLDFTFFFLFQFDGCSTVLTINFPFLKIQVFAYPRGNTTYINPGLQMVNCPTICYI